MIEKIVIFTQAALDMIKSEVENFMAVDKHFAFTREGLEKFRIYVHCFSIDPDSFYIFIQYNFTFS